VPKFVMLSVMRVVADDVLILNEFYAQNLINESYLVRDPTNLAPAPAEDKESHSNRNYSGKHDNSCGPKRTNVRGDEGLCG